jgi:predicted ATPase
MDKIKIVVTGGPSGGKTTLIEALQKDLHSQVSIVPEAASILYRGGFPRKPTAPGKIHAQRAIYLTQRELEQLVIDETKAEAVVCDRGSLDSIAYWPHQDADDFFKSLATSREKEMARYHWVLHLDTADGETFDTTNPIRTENHLEAVALNALIKQAWQGHPRRIVIPHQADFLSKIAKAKSVIQKIMSGASLEEVIASL